MNLLKQTLKSLGRKEKWVSLFALVVFVFSGAQLFSGGISISQDSKGEVFSEGMVGEIVHLNPVFTEFSAVDADISSLIFSGLVRYNAQTAEFEEDIATHVLSEDKLTYTFTMKNEILWHDGEEVTAEDIYFTYAEVIQSPDFSNPVLKSNFEGVEIELVNTREVSFTINSPNSFFFTALTVGILPQHILAEVPVAELETHEFNRAPLGTGPYAVLSPYEFGPKGETTVTLSLNELYYGETPSIESLRFIAYPSYNDLLDRRSEWNGAARLRSQQLDQLLEESLVSYQYELPQYTALFFNTDRPNLDEKNERLGVSKAIDKTEILDATRHSVPIDTPLLELDQEEWIYQYDIEEAQGALFEAGWTLNEGAEYRTSTDGEVFELTLVRRDFSETNERQEETSLISSEIIKAQLAEVGVMVNVEAYGISELSEVIRNRNYDMLLYGQSLGYNLDVFSYWHSSQATEEGLNLSNYQNAKADLYIETIRSSFEEEDREAALASLAAIIAEDVPALFLYTPSYYYLLDTKVTGFKFESILRPLDRFSNIYSWILN
ncbi:MAG: peptide/nickel transport system substrate-binding protein [Oceanicoccus sp.]|jgi:peptide/nickel transport system substrate-binding protein